MRSSTDKRRDMARSILPSTARGARQDISAAKRRNRRAVARHLSVANGVPDWDDVVDAADLRAYPDAEIAQIVGWRRGQDKLNHFERWAVRSTRHLPPEDRLPALRAVLPRGLVGDHAMSHLRRIPEVAPVAAAQWGSPHEYWAHILAERAACARRAARAAGRRRELVLAALGTPGGHRDLNRAMKAVPVCDPPRWRTLAGRHDVDAFLADVDRWYAWRTALDRFLAERVTAAR